MNNKFPRKKYTNIYYFIEDYVKVSCEALIKLNKKKLKKI